VATGLAGVSKSSLVKAFERICRLENGQLVSEGQRLALRPVRRIGIHGEQSVRGVLESLANPIALANMTLRNNGALDGAFTGVACRDDNGLVLDEIQFFTRSSTASTKTSQLIMVGGSLKIGLFL
jgi:ABC-type proline/glycine betaine transport system ATPase subunit